MINLRSTLFALALGFAAAACQKAPDLGKIQAQALLTVKSYTGELEVLQRRADANLAGFRTMDSNLPGANEAGRRLGDARGALEQLRALTLGAPGAFSAAAKGGSPGELQAAIDNTNNRLQAGTTKIIADLTAFESWAAFARPTLAQNTPPTMPPAPPTSDDPATGGSDAPVIGTPPGAPESAAKPDAAKPDAAKPDAAKPAAAKPDAAKPDAAKPAAKPSAPAATPPAAKPAAPAAKPAAAAGSAAKPAAAAGSAAK